jgi:putative transposase
MRCCNAAQSTSAATFWHTPERLHEEISAGYSYAGRTKDIEACRKSFIRNWPLKCRAIADSLEEAADRWFTFHSVARQLSHGVRDDLLLDRITSPQELQNGKAAA